MQAESLGNTSAHLICAVAACASALRHISLHAQAAAHLCRALRGAAVTVCSSERRCNFLQKPQVCALWPVTWFLVCPQAFTPVITMVALFVARLEDPSSRLIIAVVLIALGTAIASYGEINMSVLGLIIMFASETFEAIRLVMTQILLVGLKFHPSEAPGFPPRFALPLRAGSSDAACVCLCCSP